MTALGERLTPLAEAARNAPRGLPWTQAHAAYIIHFHPDVGEALVAVAKAVEALVECPLCGFPNGAHYRGDGLRKCADACPMHALAAALGVPR